MFIFSLISICAIAVFVSYRLRKSIAEILPLTVCVFILLMYILAFFRALFLVDFIMPVSALMIIILKIFKDKKNKDIGPDDNKSDRKTLMAAGSFLAAIITVCLFFIICEYKRISLWWDDINFWTTDVKSLYFLNGFAGKYGNVAPEFGDYPPGIQLFKWFFLHFNKREFVEGLSYAGYLCMNLIFAIPIAKRISAVKNYAAGLSVCILCVLMPTVANIVCFQGSCADVTMGIIYGTLLYSIWDHEDCTEKYYLIRIALYGSVLVLTKSVGIEWAVFAFIFFIITDHRRSDLYSGEDHKMIRKLIPWFIILITEGSWLAFCLINRRVSKLTSTGVRMAVSGNQDMSYWAKQKALVYLKGFALYPMHTDRTLMIDISSLAMLLLLIAAIIFGVLSKDKKDKIRFLIFTIITATASYGVIFIGHITIFATETQYSSADVMAISISRYAAPFTIGMMMLFMGIVIKNAEKTEPQRYRNKKPIAYISCAAIILLCCNYNGVYEGLIGYRNTLESDTATRNDMIDDNSAIFVDKVSKHDELGGKRVLYIQSSGESHWVHNAYLNLEVSPVAVVYGSIENENVSKDDIIKLTDSYHAAYLYADDIPDNASNAISGMTSDGFEFRKIYSIGNDGMLYDIGE